MKRIYFLILLMPTMLNSLKTEFAEKFYHDLLFENATLCAYFEPNELAISKRFGISYKNVKYKNLISYEFSDTEKKLLKESNTPIRNIIPEDKNFTKLEIKIPEQKIFRSFYFEKDKLISPTYYHSRKWSFTDTEHFRFFYSENTIYNDYATGKLEIFFTEIAELLDFSEEDKELFSRNKIYYYLCKDEREVELLTGYKARGMYELAHDYIISQFPCHYHELMHFFINFKLRELPLFTHPFFQEGFAVALGGRGGKEPDVILNVGNFLLKSEIISYKDLLTYQDFYNVDASISYPVSGIYNYFLISELGIDDYLDLYKKYSGDEKQVMEMKIVEDDLPSEEKWLKFIENAVIPDFTFSFPRGALDYRQFGNGFIAEHNEFYYFRIPATYFLTLKDKNTNHSKKFTELFAERKYEGQTYYFDASEEEISIYDLRTSNMIASYVKSFSEYPQPVKKVDECFIFGVKKELFEEDLMNYGEE